MYKVERHIFDLTGVILARKYAFITDEENISLKEFGKDENCFHLKKPLRLLSESEVKSFEDLQARRELLLTIRNNLRNRFRHNPSWCICLENEGTLNTELENTLRSFKHVLSFNREKIPRLDSYVTNQWNDLIPYTKEQVPVFIVLSEQQGEHDPYHEVVFGALVIFIKNENQINTPLLKIAAQDSNCVAVSFSLFKAKFECFYLNRSRFHFCVVYSKDKKVFDDVCVKKFERSK